MNGAPKKSIEAIDIAHHTGTAWSAVFPYPPQEFLDDMQWVAYLKVGGRNLNWFTQSMAKVTYKGQPALDLRFDDRETPPLTDADRDKITARLDHPRSRLP